MNIIAKPSDVWPKTINVRYIPSNGWSYVCIYLNPPGSPEAKEYGEGNMGATGMHATRFTRVL